MDTIYKFVIKAQDGCYWQPDLGDSLSSIHNESSHNASLNSASLFDTEEEASYRIKNSDYDKWKNASICKVTITC